MKPGYYLVVHNIVLRNLEKPNYKVRIPKGEWLVTDGVNLGRFDPMELDWVPLQWTNTLMITLEGDETLESQFSYATMPISPRKISEGFQKQMFVEPGEPIPEMPFPVLTQLESYLWLRR